MSLAICSNSSSGLVGFDRKDDESHLSTKNIKHVVKKRTGFITSRRVLFLRGPAGCDEEQPCPRVLVIVYRIREGRWYSFG